MVTDARRAWETASNDPKLAGTLEGVLFGVRAGDWRSVASAVLVLLMVAMLAAWLPARRAAGVDPLIALRHE